MIHTKEQHVQVFINHYLPSGKAWAAKHVIGSNLRLLIEGLCVEYHNGEIAIEEFIQEMMPDTTEEYIERWEKVVGIPGDCFSVANTIEERRLNIKRKLSLLGFQTADDFRKFAQLLGLEIQVNSGIDHDSTNGYGIYTPDIDFGDATTGRFTIVVKTLEQANSFNYVFDFPFQTAEQALMECVFRHAKPANCNIVFVSE